MLERCDKGKLREGERCGEGEIILGRGRGRNLIREIER
jgi:hypothetical protein